MSCSGLKGMSLGGSGKVKGGSGKESPLLSSIEWSFLRKMLNEGVFEIKPRISEQGFSYRYILKDLGLDLSDEEFASILRKLNETGIFEKRHYDSIIACPECGGTIFNIRYHCAACGSTNLSYGEALEHLTCGHIDLVESFAKNDYKCPKCQKRLRAIGVDYRKVGRIYRCVDCGFVSPSIDARTYCTKCGHRIEEDAEILHGYSYLTSEDKIRSVLESGELVLQVEETLRKLDLRHEVNYTVKGDSGMSHTWPFAVWVKSTSSMSPDLMIEFLLRGDRDELSSKIIKTAVKKVDAGVPAVLLLTQAKPDKTIKQVGGNLNIKIVHVEKPDEVSKRIRDAVKELMKSL